MLVDANLLLYAADTSSPHHERSAAWLTEQLNGPRPVGIAWESLTAYVRIATHPRASANPASAAEAWAIVEDWLACDVAWTPTATARHREIFGGLLVKYEARGNLVPDVHLVALAIEHGLTVCSADTDFARFTEVEWLNPLADRTRRR